MQDEELLRYSRHILLPGLDIEGQKRLLAASALTPTVRTAARPSPAKTLEAART